MAGRLWRTVTNAHSNKHGVRVTVDLDLAAYEG